MKKAAILIICLICVHWMALSQRTIVQFNDNWKFGKTTDNPGAITSGLGDSDWTTVNLPHTWNNLDGQDGGNNYVRGAFLYQKSLVLEPDWVGKKIFIRFGAANMKTDLYVNGNFVGSHIGGHAAFIFDITDYLTVDQANSIAVQVDNSANIDAPPLSADFTFFGGITRTVELLITDKTHISPMDFASPGVYLSADNISKTKADVHIQSLIANQSGSTEKIRVKTILKDARFRPIDSTYTDSTFESGTTKSYYQHFRVKNPHLWNGMHQAYLYRVVVQTFVNGRKTDEVIQPLGIRSFNVDVNKGFFLNGQKYDLQGVAMHEDQLDKGHAVHNSDRKRDMEIVGDLGCTFLRLAHYQHGAYTYDYCDSTGMMLWTEAPLINYIHTTDAFSQNSKSALIELIKQNYNHPSVICWGIFNEVDLQPGPDPTPLVKEMNDLVHQLDSTRPTAAAASQDERDEHWVPDLLGYNRYLGWYNDTYNDFGNWLDKIKIAHPKTKIGITEYGAGAGVHQHKINPEKPKPGGPFHPEEYQSLYHEAYWQAMAKRPFVWCTAIWVGFDFAADNRNEGEGPGINDKGLVTRDRQIKKDAFYYFKANWSKEPFVYLTSKRFSIRTVDTTEVKVYSNCKTIELKVNGKIYPKISSENHIFIWKNITLQSGDNQILVTGHQQGNTFTDACIWKYQP